MTTRGKVYHPLAQSMTAGIFGVSPFEWMTRPMVISLTDHEFSQFQTLIYDQVGITLSDQKKSLIVSRLGKRLRDLQLQSYQSYFDYISSVDGGEELTTLLDLVSTNKTDFFNRFYIMFLGN